MSDVWDGLFESTSLSTDPTKPAPKPAPIEPAARTAPVDKPKRQRKAANAVTATPVPEVAGEPAADASLFLGSDDDGDVGQAAATAAAKATLAQISDDDDGFDPFEEDGDDVPPVPVIAPEAKPEKTKKPGRPAGSKKKTVTAEQYVAELEQIDKGGPVADATFPAQEGPAADVPVESHDGPAAATPAETVPPEVDVLARAIARRLLQEVVAILQGKA